MATAEERVIARLNKQFGSGTDKLCTSRQLVDEYTLKFDEITTSKLRISGPTTNTEERSTPRSQFQTTVGSIQTAHDAIDVQIAKIDQHQEHMAKRLRLYDAHLEQVNEPQQKISKLEHLAEYLRVVQDISDISEALKANLKDDARVVGLYLSLCGEVNSPNSVIGRLEYVEAKHLKAFAENTAVYWYKVLVEKFSADFENCLKTIKWPNMGTANEVFSPTKQQCFKLAMLAEFLYLIKHPQHDRFAYNAITPSVLCPPISLPIQLLLKPFRQRFLYHFSGAKQTNRLDKPEWFYTQILGWAKDNHAFVGSTFQMAAVHAGQKENNVRLEFIRGLVQLAVEKLCNDIEEIAADDHLFAHLLDETLSFEQELRETFRYPTTFPSALTVLTQPQYLMKWLAAEENFSTSQMDAMLTRGTPWIFIDPDNLEELKIPKCADQFVRLLDAIKERYCVLPQPGHQLQFLNLQIELIDSFRRRLVQLHNTTSSEDHVGSTKILNAIHYLVSVLREWGESVHYLHLQIAQAGRLFRSAATAGGDDGIALLGADDDSEEVAAVFEKPVSEFEHWSGQIVSELAGKILDDIKAKSMQYRHDEWVRMPALGARDTFALSPTAGEMFQLMVSALHDMETELSASILRRVLRMVAQRFDVFVIDGMIMNTRFSAGGAAQFNYDMMRNLFPLFGQYMARPHLLFKRIHDACILLTLPMGSAMLLFETLKSRRGDGDDEKAALVELGVVTFTGRLAVDILGRRTDINVM